MSISTTGTSAQPVPLAPINTQRPRSDSNGMGSPTSLMSGYSTDREFPDTFPQISEEAPSIATSSAPLTGQTQNTGRPQLHHVQTNSSRRSTESVDSQGRPLKFHEFSRGRHSTAWLFNNFSFRQTIGKLVNTKH